MSISIKNLVDANDVKSIGQMATLCGVPERWLRNKVAAGEVESQRVGYNLFIANSEAKKIRNLADRRQR
jgi:hypothetical protein